VAEAPALMARDEARSLQIATANIATAAAITSAMARCANWIPTLKLHAAGRRAPWGVDHGNVGIARPAKLWRTTAPMQSCRNRRTQQATPICRTLGPTGSGSLIHGPEQETASAIRVHAKRLRQAGVEHGDQLAQARVQGLDLDGVQEDAKPPTTAWARTSPTAK